MVLSVVVVTAFGQGTTTLVFGNDTDHLVCFTTNVNLLDPADASLAGEPTPAHGPPSHSDLLADLYGSTSPSSLTLLTTTTFSLTEDGILQPANVSGMPVGTTLYFQVQVRDWAHLDTAPIMVR